MSSDRALRVFLYVATGAFCLAFAAATISQIDVWRLERVPYASDPNWGPKMEGAGVGVLFYGALSALLAVLILVLVICRKLRTRASNSPTPQL
jgi:uncharacterized iron-regulated membrane protein